MATPRTAWTEQQKPAGQDWADRSCRSCGATLHAPFLDLGVQPLANAYLTAAQLSVMEPFYPLRVYVCDRCFLVQVEPVVDPEHIFSDYAYFSSYSDSWLQHARAYADTMVQRLGLNERSQVVEIGSNDGYLLQYFAQRGVPVLGIEPAANVAAVAAAKSIPTRVEFFGEESAQALVEGGHRADLLVGNNVLAQVPDLTGFVRGMKVLLKPQGVVTIEFPHLVRLLAENQFDTIYHEHFSYFSLLTVQQIFAAHGLVIFDVQELPTHGGSLRVYARHAEDRSRMVEDRVPSLAAREEAAGLNRVETYRAFSEGVRQTKYGILDFLIGAKREGKRIVAYGAPAKGNTLLNYCGIGLEFLDYTVDRSPHKQGLFLPGTHLPILRLDRVAETKPDYLLILPWNLKDEIMGQMAHIRRWGGRFLVLIPEVSVFP